MIFLGLLRYIFMAPLAIIWTILCCGYIGIICLGPLNREREQALLYYWSSILMRLFNVHVKTLGGENLNQGGVLLLFNHTSLFDITAISVSTRKVHRFGAKIELFRIPLFGKAMKRVGILPIARQNRNEVVRVYEDAKLRISKGESFVLAPEGTRMKTPELGTFKSGPFYFAIQAQVPIVPVVIKGAHEVMPKTSILINWRNWKSLITVRFLTPIDTKGLTLDDRENLKNRVREIFLTELKNELKTS